MPGYSDAYAPSSLADAIHMASDIKEDQSVFSSWSSIANIVAIFLVIGLVVFLTIELAWRDRRQRLREAEAKSGSESDPHKGESSP
ncbi:hypothetical protein OHS71_08670 [Streptomyces sp. NBC_00377]|uniref:hypothetical protein n=1 Tax=unclassified Streptomyces TaxID=2593676 RepID=UPI002E219B02|nr:MULTISPECIES: hypothetical protein [unclassified Streptomyces]